MRPTPEGRPAGPQVSMALATGWWTVNTIARDQGGWLCRRDQSARYVSGGRGYINVWARRYCDPHRIKLRAKPTIKVTNERTGVCTLAEATHRLPSHREGTLGIR